MQSFFRPLWKGGRLGPCCDLLRPVAAQFEEGAEQGGRLDLQNAGSTGVGVVQTGIRGQVVEGTGRAGFRVWGGVDEATYPGGVEGTGAHRAGFQGSVEGTSGEAPTPEFPGGAAEGEEFCVGGRIFARLALVMGYRQDLLVPRDHSADGDLSLLGGSLGLFEGAAHQLEVPF
jgi:hypothetical protein